MAACGHPSSNLYCRRGTPSPPASAATLPSPHREAGTALARAGAAAAAAPRPRRGLPRLRGVVLATPTPATTGGAATERLVMPPPTRDGSRCL